MMGHVLVVSSSAMGDQSQSRMLALEFAKAWRAAHPGAGLVERKLLPENTPHVDLDMLSAFTTPEDRQTPKQKAAMQYSDALVDELIGADAVVIASPMYTFTVSSTLKAWLEYINRPGRTFMLPEEGKPPRGLITGKTVVVVCTRGSVLSGTPLEAMDYQAPFMRWILKFFGMDAQIVLAEGLAHGHPEPALAQAREALAKIARGQG